MRLKRVLTISSAYLALIGVAVMFIPEQFGIGAVPEDPPSELIALLRIFAGPLIGIAVLNWLARDLAPSAALDAILLANIVGFGCVAASDVWSVFAGDARDLAKVFLVVHLGFTAAFVLAKRAARHRGSD